MGLDSGGQGKSARRKKRGWRKGWWRSGGHTSPDYLKGVRYDFRFIQAPSTKKG